MTDAERLAEFNRIRDELEALMTEDELDTYPVFDHLCDLIDDLEG
jgi:hypothetical protein